MDIIKKIKDSNIIDSYWIAKHENDMIHLLFNTKLRWVACHQVNDEMYEFNWENLNGEVCEEIFELEEFLPENVMYVHTSQTEKDQISFYFLPFKFFNEKTVIRNERR